MMLSDRVRRRGSNFFARQALSHDLGHERPQEICVGGEKRKGKRVQHQREITSERGIGAGAENIEPAFCPFNSDLDMSRTIGIGC